MQDRKQFGKSIASFPGSAVLLADMATELVAARQMVRLAASKLDAGPATPPPTAPWLRFATDAGFTVVNEALQLHGGGTATSANTRWSACCATPACTRFWKAPTKSCASSSPAACSMAMRRGDSLMPQRARQNALF